MGTRGTPHSCTWRCVTLNGLSPYGLSPCGGACPDVVSSYWNESGAGGIPPHTSQDQNSRERAGTGPARRKPAAQAAAAAARGGCGARRQGVVALRAPGVGAGTGAATAAAAAAPELARSRAPALCAAAAAAAAACLCQGRAGTQAGGRGGVSESGGWAKEKRARIETIRVQRTRAGCMRSRARVTAVALRALQPRAPVHAAAGTCTAQGGAATPRPCSTRGIATRGRARPRPLPTSSPSGPAARPRPRGAAAAARPALRVPPRPRRPFDCGGSDSSAEPTLSA